MLVGSQTWNEAASSNSKLTFDILRPSWKADINQADFEIISWKIIGILIQMLLKSLAENFSLKGPIDNGQHWHTYVERDLRRHLALN